MDVEANRRAGRLGIPPRCVRFVTTLPVLGAQHISCRPLGAVLVALALVTGAPSGIQLNRKYQTGLRQTFT